MLLDRGFPGENVTVLLDEEATRDGILSAIAEFGDATSPEGRAVFAFAGHTRRRHGENHIVAADGQTISAAALSEALSSVRAPMWVALPTCYAAGFALPGTVGPNRIATFASTATERSFESTRFGHSFLFEYMVKRFLDGTAKRTSVERAFTSAKRGLERDYPRFTPVMDDQLPGEFALGRRTASGPRKVDRPAHRPAREERNAPSRATPTPSRPPDKEDEPNDPQHDRDDGDGEEPKRQKGIGDWKACGTYPSFGDCDRSEDED